MCAHSFYILLHTDEDYNPIIPKYTIVIIFLSFAYNLQKPQLMRIE